MGGAGGMYGVDGDDDEDLAPPLTGTSAPVVASTLSMPAGETVTLLPPPFPRIYMLHPPLFEANKVRSCVCVCVCVCVRVPGWMWCYAFTSGVCWRVHLLRPPPCLVPWSSRSFACPCLSERHRSSISGGFAGSSPAFAHPARTPTGVHRGSRQFLQKRRHGCVLVLGEHPGSGPLKE